MIEPESRMYKMKYHTSMNARRNKCLYKIPERKIMKKLNSFEIWTNTMLYLLIIILTTYIVAIVYECYRPAECNWPACDNTSVDLPKDQIIKIIVPRCYDDIRETISLEDSGFFEDSYEENNEKKYIYSIEKPITITQNSTSRKL